MKIKNTKGEKGRKRALAAARIEWIQWYRDDVEENLYLALFDYFSDIPSYYECEENYIEGLQAEWPALPSLSVEDYVGEFEVDLNGEISAWLGLEETIAAYLRKCVLPIRGNRPTLREWYITSNNHNCTPVFSAMEMRLNSVVAGKEVPKYSQLQKTSKEIIDVRLKMLGIVR